jgi:predicted enzyme related to lactoylglutathione lyase
MIPEKEANPPDPVAYGRGIAQGLGINLLVRNVDRSARFQVAVFGAQIRYWEDWSYRNHEMMGSVAGLEARGGGIELRLYGIDPDQAEAAANRYGAAVLAPAADKPHGLREVHIVDDDGYVWVPSRPTR